MTRVILTPKREGVEWRFDNDGEFISYGWNEPIVRGGGQFIFSNYDWEMTAEIGPSKKYAELIERLGEDKANEAWEVLFG